MNETSNGKWSDIKSASKHYAVTKQTLRNWEKQGKIQSQRTRGGHRRYFIPEHNFNPITYREQPIQKTKTNNPNICYARVSSFKQSDDLERQCAHLQSLFPNHEIIKDIGSGINFKRKGLLSILERARRGDLKEIVVAHRDRLCRFAFDLIQHILELENVKIIVLQHEDSSPQQEFTEDLISIVHVFSCRFNGLRRYEKALQGEERENPGTTKKRKRKEIINDEEENRSCK